MTENDTPLPDLAEIAAYVMSDEGQAQLNAEVEEAIRQQNWENENLPGGVEYATQTGIEAHEVEVKSVSQPYLLAESLVKRRFTHNCYGSGHAVEHGMNCLTVRRWQSSWVRHDGTAWRGITDEMAEATFIAAIRKSYEMVQGENGEEIRRWGLPAPELVNGTVKMLKALLILGDEVTHNSWLKAPPVGMRDQVIPVENGLLSVPERVLTPHTPGFFNPCASPLAYDSNAVCPRWNQFLEEIFPGDKASQDLLQEMFGYVLSGRTDLQKMFLLVGKGRAGKGTIARVLKLLVGLANIASPSLDSLIGDFGLQPLLGKSLGIIGDARLGDNVDTKIIERLLSISGEDSVPVNRKNKPFIDTMLPTRLVMLSNQLPNFKDSTGVLASRFSILVFNQSFLGQEDTKLTETLSQELAGILNWALDGLDRLTEVGRLTTPSLSAETQGNLRAQNAPEIAFIGDCTDNHGWVRVEDAFWAYCWWREDRGMPLVMDRTSEKDLRREQTRFGKMMLTNAPWIRKRRLGLTEDKNRSYVYDNLSLMPHVEAQAYSIRPDWTR